MDDACADIMVAALLMNDQQDRRVTWTTRINVRESERDTIRAIARAEKISVATMIGIAVENFVTARSTA